MKICLLLEFLYTIVFLKQIYSKNFLSIKSKPLPHKKHFWKNCIPCKCLLLWDLLWYVSKTLLKGKISWDTRAVDIPCPTCSACHVSTRKLFDYRPYPSGQLIVLIHLNLDKLFIVLNKKYPKKPILCWFFKLLSPYVTCNLQILNMLREWQTSDEEIEWFDWRNGKYELYMYVVLSTK